MWDTSKIEPLLRQCCVESMIESLYWMGME